MIRRPGVAVGVLLGVAALVAGCAGATRPPLSVADPHLAPWALPAAALGSQRLYRVSYDGPDGGGSFRLTLHLESADRYQVRAVDPIGRALWSLDVRGSGGLWLDHRAAGACRLEGDLEVVAGRLTPFPLTALPALLLGRLPARPAGAADGGAADGGEEDPDAAGRGRIGFTDGDGRHWSATLDRGDVSSWAVREPGAEAPAVWWRRHEGEALLSDRRRGVQLSWRETVVEPLAGPLGSLEVPASFALVPCEVLSVPVPADGG